MTASLNISDQGMDNDTIEDYDQCLYEMPTLTDMRIWLVTVFGSMISVASMVENTFFFFHFLRRKHHRTTYNMYMMMIAFFDVFVSATYILLMSVGIYGEYMISPTVMGFYYSYMLPMLTVSHSAITSSSFLILAATFERYCITLNTPWTQTVQRRRKRIVLVAILLGLISKGGIAFEMQYVNIEECAGTMNEHSLRFRFFSQQGHIYNEAFRFYYRNIVTVFFPFFAMLWLNILIVKALHAQEKYENISNNVPQSKRKTQARAATRTMVLVVCTYIISNISSVVITTWEHINKASLESFPNFYALSIDMLSILTNMACAFRPVIYMTCQAGLRKEVLQSLKYFVKEIVCRERSDKTLTVSKGKPCTLALSSGEIQSADTIIKTPAPHIIVSNLDGSDNDTGKQNELISKLLDNMNNETLL